MGPRKIREKLIYINADTCDWLSLGWVIRKRIWCDGLSSALRLYQGDGNYDLHAEVRARPWYGEFIPEYPQVGRKNGSVD